MVRSGQQVRITAQLIHAATDRHLWAQSYDGELSDVLRLQQRIAREIAAAIGPPVCAAPRPRGPHGRAVNPQAYDLYLKGVFAGGRETFEGFRTAVAYFEEAIARQPDFAEAYAALAQAQHQFLFAGPLSPRETMPKAEAAARKALQLDETLAQAHRTLGAILHHFSLAVGRGRQGVRARPRAQRRAPRRATRQGSRPSSGAAVSKRPLPSASARARTTRSRSTRTSTWRRPAGRPDSTTGRSRKSAARSRSSRGTRADTSSSA